MAKALACTSLAISSLTFLACSNRPQSVPAESRATELSVLELSAPVYDPTGAAGDGSALQVECARWSITREQAETFLRLSKPISPEEQHSRFYTLPCHVDGRAQREGRTWQFRINGAATVQLTSNGETQTLGCYDPACEPLVLLMPEGGDQ